MAQYGAARGKKDRVRTINFYEIVKWVNRSSNERLPHSDWDEILSGLDGVKLSDRIWEGPDRTLIGEVLRVDGQRHLKLMLVRDQDAWLEIYNPDAESIAELNLGDAEQLLETTIVAFLGFGNVIGLIQGSTSAPTPTAFEEWLNGLELVEENVTLTTQPMVSHDAQQLIRRSTELSEMSVKVHTNRAEALDARGSGLAGILRSVRSEYGPMVVTVTLQPGRAKDQVEGRRAVRDEGVIIADAAAAGEVQGAKAKLIYIEPDDSRHTEDIDFAKQRITAKRNIPTTSQDGSPIRNESAVRAILQVARENEDELRAIADTKK
ncbi:hypothetical protein [Leifsonia xyli]|uniref:hypothetical protein n=1 Tax=Leifsonia xyli TaxID=1575 RepID=UPI000AC9FDB4